MLYDFVNYDMDKELLAWASAIIQKAQSKNIYGEVVIKFEAGTIVNVSKKENYKPPKKAN